jgi:hypothetical protein
MSNSATITVDTYLDLALAALPHTELSVVMRAARRTITTKATAQDLGWLTCRGYGYDRACSLSPDFASIRIAACFLLCGATRPATHYGN